MTDNGHPLRVGLVGQAPSPDGLGHTATIPDAVFNYTAKQAYNVHVGLHPDCGLDAVCTVCGASEEAGACGGDLSGLPKELFEEAACSAHNANIKSIGQVMNWQMHSRHAQAFDKAARALFAKAIEARSGETERLDPQDESAGRQALPKDSTLHEVEN